MLQHRTSKRYEEINFDLYRKELEQPPDSLRYLINDLRHDRNALMKDYRRTKLNWLQAIQINVIGNNPYEAQLRISMIKKFNYLEKEIHILQKRIDRLIRALLDTPKESK